jgi:outer membrane protein assembly factor BamB
VKRALVVAAALVVLAAVGAGLAWYLHLKQASRDVKGSSTVEFVTTEAAPPPPPEPGIAWPTYGHDAARLRFGNGISLAPPYRRLWTFRAQSLVEFPPAIGYGRLFFASNEGTLFAIGAKNGKRAWKLRTGRCVAASPALDRHVVYEAFLNRPPCNAQRGGHGVDGEVIAFAVGHGKIHWKHKIGPSESSPLLVGDRLYVGDWNGDVWAFDADNGRLLWKKHVGGAIKGAIASAGGRLYVGSYDGHLYCLSTSGRQLWRASGQRRLYGNGRFYSTPALAYGRVYIGSTDGKVYSFGATTGKLRWSSSTGGYVYASPAVWNDLVLVGSYSGRFYAFDAATGAKRWQFDAHGKISGSATVIGDVVYFATLKQRTYALNARTGKQLWSFPDGKYTPVVAVEGRLFLIGYGTVYGMVPK